MMMYYLGSLDMINNALSYGMCWCDQNDPSVCPRWSVSTRYDGLWPGWQEGRFRGAVSEKSSWKGKIWQQMHQVKAQKVDISSGFAKIKTLSPAICNAGRVTSTLCAMRTRKSANAVTGLPGLLGNNFHFHEIELLAWWKLSLSQDKLIRKVTTFTFKRHTELKVSKESSNICFHVIHLDL